VKQFDSTEKRDVVHLGIDDDDDDDDDRSEWLNQPEATLYNKTLIFPQNKNNFKKKAGYNSSTIQYQLH
jgi:hypothetical protein